MRAAIFDIDGTLLDSVDLHARAWVEAFAHFGVTTDPAEVRRQIGKGGDELMPVFLSQERIRREGEAIEAYRSDLFKRRYLPDVRPFPGVRPLFERIHEAGLTIALASSGKRTEVDRYTEILGIGDLVDVATSADDADRSKPHPDIFQAALRKLDGVAPDAAHVVGDTPYDAEAAAKAGLPTIGLLCGGFPEADLTAAGCVAIYRDPQDLLAGFASSPLAGT
ncbi:phosphorylated carbohydrates phosphatase [Methylobacterium phyllosphaerae]|jgi:HAD superfamily hydrolase (TIGR01509 family)|uniref:Haloacid dehalogenase superfamily, subfamily IA, variant 3 with third motif having DD or ED/haloacid dehalogenase superfamily, subfamily IA, variant 1 with third motif having Dx(3-4)D or Dx(3-4)E n=2 Tax=Methylobacterium TaxID=407 RepID=A0AAE8HR80_9HYPH|nr:MULTISPECIES: HAD family hydrolase [Methylobacterium]KOX51580.1 HAD family hydrolase [Streptomyces purpurogeneiscleroticus]APT29522.1 phosphorylated carbohydrates phosphatase [Methylobacterium phyllosphaerae]MBA9062863.1 HAD superfamily hydrolase (TIGR01509 family) [Methylobacterium fujisawaense]MDE4915878.1 HAD family hydrolase [Methylobacterium sp. 092160098-2]RUP12208.1 MAG: HAD family hydrolase [Methylobacterium sp.]